MTDTRTPLEVIRDVLQAFRDDAEDVRHFGLVKLADNALAALAKIESAEPVRFVPEGWQLVPKEITKSMAIAAENAVDPIMPRYKRGDDCHPNDIGHVCPHVLDVEEVAPVIWEALLAKAPKPPVHPQSANFDALKTSHKVAELEKDAARPESEWHEDFGDVCWWAVQDGELLGEPAWIGTPLGDDWPGYHTHWTPHPPVPVAFKNADEIPAPSLAETRG